MSDYYDLQLAIRGIKDTAESLKQPGFEWSFEHLNYEKLARALPVIEEALAMAATERSRAVEIVRAYWETSGDLIETNNGARLAFEAVAAEIEGLQ